MTSTGVYITAIVGAIVAIGAGIICGATTKNENFLTGFLTGGGYTLGIILSIGFCIFWGMLMLRISSWGTSDPMLAMTNVAVLVAFILMVGAILVALWQMGSDIYQGLYK